VPGYEVERSTVADSPEVARFTVTVERFFAGGQNKAKVIERDVVWWTLWGELQEGPKETRPIIKQIKKNKEVKLNPSWGVRLTLPALACKTGTRGVLGGTARTDPGASCPKDPIRAEIIASSHHQGGARSNWWEDDEFQN
jgi:hypothetical protein